VLLTTPGWRSRRPAFDLLTYVYGVREFLASGAVPRHGDTGSYGSLKPPGTAWLMLPSALLFSDPRLSEYASTGILYFLILLGVFLLARTYLGTVWSYVSRKSHAASPPDARSPGRHGGPCAAEAGPHSLTEATATESAQGCPARPPACEGTETRDWRLLGARLCTDR
jgi:hypothetical protein